MFKKASALLVILIAFSCKEKTQFSKDFKKIRGDWEMYSIEKGQDKVDYYPEKMKVTFEECVEQNSCFARLLIDEHQEVILGYSMGWRGKGMVLGYREHTGNSTDSLLNLFVEEINWFVESSDENKMELSNKIIGYRLGLQKL